MIIVTFKVFYIIQEEIIQETMRYNNPLINTCEQNKAHPYRIHDYNPIHSPD